jgi:translation initiation factor 1 (eIF-1/SUI1)
MLLSEGKPVLSAETSEVLVRWERRRVGKEVVVVS